MKLCMETMELYLYIGLTALINIGEYLNRSNDLALNIKITKANQKVKSKGDYFIFYQKYVILDKLS